MKRPILNIKPNIAAAAFVALTMGATAFDSISDLQLGLLNQAQAAAPSDQEAGKGQGPKTGDRGGKGTTGQRGRSTTDVMGEADEDSDRPDWAGGDKEENPHRGEGNPNPGDMKGEDYGDLWVYVRDEVTGLPIVVDCEDATCYQIVVCTDADCTTTETYLLSTDPEAELPAGVVPVEVELGRLNIGRSPPKVVEHAEEEALSKITVDGVILGLDPASRITVDGATIDSPLENLALYIALMTGDTQVLTALEPLLAESSIFELAAALLAGAADKTGEITTDVVFYSNIMYDLVPADADYVSYEGMTYDRSVYDTTVNYNYYDVDGTTILSGTLNLRDYLEATQPVLPGDDGIVLFTVAADDALQIIELIHTQIHDAELPGG